jgi:hypothetical protein
MTDELKHKHASTHDDFERSDLSLRPVFVALVFLAIVCLAVAGMVWGLYRYLDTQHQASQPPQNPLVKSEPPDARYATREQFKQEIKGEFPDPRLEEDEVGQLNSIRLAEEKTLNSYGWVDEKAGMARIPITRAMELVVQRGLPVMQRGAASQMSAAAKK